MRYGMLFVVLALSVLIDWLGYSGIHFIACVALVFSLDRRTA